MSWGILIEKIPELDSVRYTDGVPSAARALNPIYRQLCGVLEK